MSNGRSAASASRLGLKVGDVVEVRSREEILATLTEDGCFDSLPFMPEMLAFCGRRFTVEKRAHKTCDTITWAGLRRLEDTVHLKETRCNGAAHGGCEAACAIYWKEAWLRRVDAPPSAAIPAARCSEDNLRAATRRAPVEGESRDEIFYRCQATDLLKFSSPMSPLDVRQYVRDVQSGNVGVRLTLIGVLWRIFRWANMNLRGFRLQQWLFNHMQRVRGGMPNILLGGPHTKTPKETLGLVPGERVQIKSVEEIRDTLNAEQRNRGLYFDKEMTIYCGGTYTVRGRVTKIIEEKTGRMMQLPGDCLILDGVVCTGKFHWNCPRMSPSYFREIWMRRADGAATPGGDASAAT